jgi:hypothetical protein
MSYQLTHFDSVALPLYNLKQERGTPDVPSSLRRYIGGVVDYAGSNQLYPDVATVALTGIYQGESGYLIRQDGAILTDQSGNRLSVGTASNRLRVQLEELTAKVGQRGQLWRTLENGTRQWKYARLLRAGYEAKVDERLQRAEMKMFFETWQPAWRTASLVTATGNANAPLVASIGGNVTVLDAILAITASATITRVAITGSGISLLWTGSLTSGQILRIDSGLRTVRIGTATNAYSGFAVQTGHTANRWLELPPGLNTLAVRTDAAATLSMTYYDQWL